MIFVYVDYQLVAGDTAFEIETKMIEQKFQSRPGHCDQLSFAGVEISQQPDCSVVMHQRPHAERIQLLPKHSTFAAF